ncbi:YbaN family protein [Rhodocista pekingensis]|uniref:YbaN family protein n=1 Tax=Rhodocista pekingensis TaxID=201185 RepID=A0ABW2KT81_9PROT
MDRVRMEAENSRPDAETRRIRRRWHLVYVGLGYTFVAIGAVGVVLPVLPTTPFLLLAVWAFMRSNPEAAAKLLNHSRFGPLLRAWHEEGAIPTRAKIMSISLMFGAWLIVLWRSNGMLLPAIVGTILVGTGTYILTRPAPKKKPAVS